MEIRHKIDDTCCKMRGCNKCDMYRQENEKLKEALLHNAGYIDELEKELTELKELCTHKKPLWIYDDEPICTNCQNVLDGYETICDICNQFLDWS